MSLRDREVGRLLSSQARNKWRPAEFMAVQNGGNGSHGVSFEIYRRRREFHLRPEHGQERRDCKKKKRLMDPFKRLPAERIARPRREMVITVINARIPAELPLEPRIVASSRASQPSPMSPLPRILHTLAFPRVIATYSCPLKKAL